LSGNKSAEKQARAGQKRRLRNRVATSQIKTVVTKARQNVSGSDQPAAEAAVADVVKALDRAASKGILHPNSAARRKSRLVKQLNKMEAPPAAEDKAAE
jgi:small subunit ribosomal protein S20